MLKIHDAAAPLPNPSNVMYPKEERNRDLNWHQCVKAHTSDFGRYWLGIAHRHEPLNIVNKKITLCC